ncbi:hypothetical protein [Streptomyces sp. CMB-StM0423]|uniref:hypothetical protein n=1 Tax=Streptomyces sp. CMB-StM0423 TaxID=2059884 RepID=UPI000C6FF777|nr:hypothetical protein [Streptomyces sp. CMB-StM0423]AUH41297.1 hypothetical protein CXR04_14525 [Streptomyces sp. CMB-StM0423]
MTFVQLIEYESDNPEELGRAMDEWMAATEGKRTMSREIHARDRESSRHFVDIVEFPSYEQAMVNNDLPETQRIAGRLRELCTSEPRFVDLDVVDDRS